MFKTFKGLMLNIDPSGRPNINEVIFHLENIAQAKAFQFNQQLTFLKKTESLLFSNNNQANSYNNIENFNSSSSSANQNSSSSAINTQSTSNWMGNASSLFKGNSLLKTIKDASTKVMDTVQKYI